MSELKRAVCASWVDYPILYDAPNSDDGILQVCRVVGHLSHERHVCELSCISMSSLMALVNVVINRSIPALTSSVARVIYTSLYESNSSCFVPRVQLCGAVVGIERYPDRMAPIGLIPQLYLFAGTPGDEPLY
jgi:hypothetical protein